MKKLVFKTKEGVELYFDSEKDDYESTDICAIENALIEDLKNSEKDPIAAKYAQILIAEMIAMDCMKGF